MRGRLWVLLGLWVAVLPVAGLLVWMEDELEPAPPTRDPDKKVTPWVQRMVYTPTTANRVAVARELGLHRVDERGLGPDFEPTGRTLDAAVDARAEAFGRYLDRIKPRIVEAQASADGFAAAFCAGRAPTLYYAAAFLIRGDTGRTRVLTPDSAERLDRRWRGFRERDVARLLTTWEARVDREGADTLIALSALITGRAPVAAQRAERPFQRFAREGGTVGEVFEVHPETQDLLVDYLAMTRVVAEEIQGHPDAYGCVDPEEFGAE